MSDRLALQLSDGWALLFDPNQWMLAKARNLRSERKWQPLTFIGSTKTTLLRVTAENGIAIDPAAQAELDSWPERFLDWYARQNAGRRAA